MVRSMFAYAVTGALLATTAAAAAIEKRNPRFKFCKDRDFVNCRTFDNIRLGRCYDLPDDWNDTCSSAIAYDGLSCTIWSDPGCRGTSAGPVTGSKKYRNLADFNMDDKSSSFECYRS